MSIKKVLYFGYSLNGINNIVNINDGLKKYGIETKLLHIGSRYEANSNNSLKYSKIKGVDCFDISYYSDSLFDIIKNEDPDCIIGFDIYTLMDRAVILNCKYLGISYIYLSHGYLTSDDDIEEGIKHINSGLKKGIVSKLYRNIKYVIPDYLSAQRRMNRSIFSAVNLIVKTFLNPAKNTIYGKFNFDLDASKLLVYSNKDKEFLINVREFPNHKVIIVGNPEYDDLDFSVQKQQNTINEYVVYLEDGLVHAGIWTKTDWYFFIDEINNICKKKCQRLVIRLHPRTNLEEHLDFFNDKDNVEIINDTNMAELVKNASCCISHYSSTIMYALILNVPVVSPRWGLSKSLLKNYPSDIIKYLYSMQDFNDFLLNPVINKTAIENYLNEIIGYKEAPVIPKILREILSVKD
jgi:hypothetical protein